MKTMKNIYKLAAGLLLMIAPATLLTSCEKDNYDEPEAAIMGVVYDSTTGKPLQVAAGKASMQIRIYETSWGEKDTTITVTPQDLNMRQDGTFTNTRLFAGTYTVQPFQGAFYPVGDDQIKTVTLKGGSAQQVDFVVTPYLSINWVKEPYMDGDTLKCQVKFTRNTGEGTMPDVDRMQLYISHTQYVGTASDAQIKPTAVVLSNDQEGTVIELKSLPIKYSNHYWVRVGANCKDTYKKSNFTDIKEIDVTVP